MVKFKFKYLFSRRRMTYYAIKLAEQSGTPECIAKGVFLGLFIGLIIPFGLQIVIVLPLAFLFKANKLVSCLFTMITNHFTVAFIYPFQCVLGSYIIVQPLKYEKVSHMFMEFLKSPSFHELGLLGEEIVIPFFVGGALLAIAFSIPGYFISLRIVRAIRNRRARKKQLQREKLQVSPE